VPDGRAVPQPAVRHLAGEHELSAYHERAPRACAPGRVRPASPPTRREPRPAAQSAALPNPEGVEPHPDTVTFFPDGWVAWDGYRENESYRVVWSLPGGKGSHRVPRSRGITSLAVSPDGRWIALSVTSGLSIGSTRDAAYVLGTADGREAFRKYFPKYTRSSLAFLGPGRFVYTDLEGVNVLEVQ